MKKQPNAIHRHGRGLAFAFAGGASLLATNLLYSQKDDEVFELSPFTVEASEDTGYQATSTLAGTRIRTDLKDVGSAITVITKEFLEDVGAVDNQTLLTYTTGTEVGGTETTYQGAGNGTAIAERGNFTNPNSNTRVRGLARADNTRNFFVTDVPWDNYIVDRIDMQRGPNSILFGMGSPAGIINATTHDATFREENKFEFRLGSYGSTRVSYRGNRVLMEDQLAVKVALLTDNEGFRQDPAYEDDERAYVAVKYEPSFLKTDSSVLTVKANYELGNINSNRPRTLTPQDNITAFFRPIADGNGDYTQLGGVDQRLFDPVEVRQRNWGVGYGQVSPDLIIDGANVDNPDYIPYLANLAQAWAGPVFFWDSPTSSDISYVETADLNKVGGLAIDGSRDGEIWLPYRSYVSLANYDDYAVAAGLPLADLGQYRRQHILDPNIFDFYNKLIDGPNKYEWVDWEVYNASVSHTFLDGNLGYDISYFEQENLQGRTGILGWNDAIYVDLNTHYLDGSPNPNVGRPFVGDVMIGANNTNQRDRDAARATAFFRHDFRRHSESWLTRLLGNHTITGLKSESNYTTDSRNFHRYRYQDDWVDFTTHGATMKSLGWDYQHGTQTPSTHHYIGDSLIGLSSATQANITNLQALQLPSTMPIWAFDSTWNAPGVVPGDPWINPRGENDTQSDNHDNYVGWTYVTPVLTDSLADPAAMNANTQKAFLSRSEIESEALVWQGYFWDNAIVGTWGWREDHLNTYQKGAPETLKIANVDPEVYNLNVDPKYESGQSHSYSVAAHVERLLGNPDWLPFNVSLYYNESENFQPGAGRNNIFGLPIDAPSGETRDKSILISGKDGKYSLKITKYKTTISNASSSYVNNTWIIGSLLANGESWANVFDYNIIQGQWSPGPDNIFIDDGGANGAPTKPWYNQLNPPTGPYDPAWEDSVVAAWREYRDEVNERWPTMAPAWNLDGWGTEIKKFSQKDPNGLNYTEDATSIGTEFEFTAQPTKNLRLTMNATKTEAIRNNVGGSAVKDFVELTDWYIANTDMAHLRWWGAKGPNFVWRYWNRFRSKYALTELLEGTASPELRKWNFNAIGNYSFFEGPLKGFSVGGGLRWQDDVILGYKVEQGENNEAIYDLNSPFMGPAETKIDFMASYKRKLGNDMNWRIQLNVRDLFAKKELIPISTQPDGSIAAARIPGATTWTLTNSFEF